VPYQIATAVALSAIGGLVLVAVGDWRLMLALMAAGVLVGLGMMRPALLVSVFVLVRPILDTFSASELGGVSSANPAGALGLLLLGALAVVLAGDRTFFRPSAMWPFVAVLAVSTTAAAHSLLSLGATIGVKPAGELLRLSVLVGIYLLAANLFREPQAARRLFVLVGLSGVVPAAYGIYEWAAGTVEVLPGYEYSRITGTFSGPLPFSAYLAVCALVLISARDGAMRAWVRLPALALILTALVRTYSREGWVIFVIGAIALLWGRHKAQVVAIAVVVAVVVAAVPTIQARVFPAETGSSAGEGFQSYTWRIDNWEGLLAKASEQPLFGWGLKTTTYVNPRAPVRGAGVPGGGYDAHNTAVRLLVEGGVVLLAVYAILVVVIIGRLRRIQRSRWELQPFARTAYWLWVILLVIALTTDDPLEQSATMFAVLALTGGVEGAYGRWLETREGPAEGDR